MPMESHPSELPAPAPLHPSTSVRERLIRLRKEDERQAEKVLERLKKKHSFTPELDNTLPWADENEPEMKAFIDRLRRGPDSWDFEMPNEEERREIWANVVPAPSTSDDDDDGLTFETPGSTAEALPTESSNSATAEKDVNGQNDGGDDQSDSDSSSSDEESDDDNGVDSDTEEAVTAFARHHVPVLRRRLKRHPELARLSPSHAKFVLRLLRGHGVLSGPPIGTTPPSQLSAKAQWACNFWHPAELRVLAHAFFRHGYLATSRQRRPYKVLARWRVHLVRTKLKDLGKDRATTWIQEEIESLCFVAFWAGALASKLERKHARKYPKGMLGDMTAGEL